MSVSMAHMLFIMSMLVPSAGIMMHFIPLSVMEQVMWHIIGIIDAIGIELAMFMDGIDMGMDIGICADFIAAPCYISVR